MASGDDVPATCHTEMQIEKYQKQIESNCLQTENVLITEGPGISGEFVFAGAFRYMRFPLLCGQFHTAIFQTAIAKNSRDFCALSRAIFETVRKEDFNVDIRNSESAKQDLRIVESKHLGAIKKEPAVVELMHSEMRNPKSDDETRHQDKAQESGINDSAHKVAAKPKLDINEIVSKATEQSSDINKIRHLGPKKQELYINEIIQPEVIKRDMGTYKTTQPEATKQESGFNEIMHSGKFKGGLDINETTQQKVTKLDSRIDESTQRKVTKLDLNIAESFETLQLNLDHSVNIACSAEQPSYAKPIKGYADSRKMDAKSRVTILKPHSLDTEIEGSTTLQKHGAGCIQECSRSQVKAMSGTCSSATTESLHASCTAFSIGINQSSDIERNQTQQTALQAIAKPCKLSSSSKYTDLCRHEIQHSSVTKPSCRVQYKCPQAERRKTCTQGTQQWAMESSVRIIAVPGRTIGYRVVSSKKQETSDSLSGRILQTD